MRCPYCGKKIAEDERYCYHCEQDISKTTEDVKAKIPKPVHINLKEDFRKTIRFFKNLFKK